MFNCLFYDFSAYGSLNVRGLLDMRSHCLKEFDFTDPYSQVNIPFLAGTKSNITFATNMEPGQPVHLCSLTRPEF